MIRTMILAAVIALVGGIALAEGDCSKAKGDATTKINAPAPVTTASTN